MHPKKVCTLRARKARCNGMCAKRRNVVGTQLPKGGLKHDIETWHFSEGQAYLPKHENLHWVALS